MYSSFHYDKYSIQSFRYSSLKIDPNSSQNWLRWFLDLAKQNLLNRFFLFIFVQSYKVVNLTRLKKYWFRGCISAKLWSIKNKLGTLHQQHDLRFNAKVGNSATCGFMSWQRINSFAYNFWKHCPNAVIYVFSDFLQQADYDDVSFVIFHNVLVSHIEVNTK